MVFFHTKDLPFIMGCEMFEATSSIYRCYSYSCFCFLSLLIAAWCDPFFSYVLFLFLFSGEDLGKGQKEAKRRGQVLKSFVSNR